MTRKVIEIISSRDSENEYRCEKSGKRVPRIDPVCPSPNNYCEYRHMCVVYELYKSRRKKNASGHEGSREQAS